MQVYLSSCGGQCSPPALAAATRAGRAEAQIAGTRTGNAAKLPHQVTLSNSPVSREFFHKGSYADAAGCLARKRFGMPPREVHWAAHGNAFPYFDPRAIYAVNTTGRPSQSLYADQSGSRGR